MDLPVTGGMEEHQRRQRVLRLMAIPVRPFERRLARDHLSTDGTAPVLWSQDVGATGRRGVPCQLPSTGRDVRRPAGINGLGVPPDLQMTRRCDGLRRAEDPRAGVGSGEPPRRSPGRGQVAGGAPASGVVRVAPCGPAASPPPSDALELGDGGATEHVAVIVRPASSDRGEGADERRWRAARAVRAEGVAPGVEGRDTGLAGGQLPRGRCPLGPLVWA